MVNEMNMYLKDKESKVDIKHLSTLYALLIFANPL